MSFIPLFLTSSKRSCDMTCSPGEAAVAVGTVASGAAGTAGAPRGERRVCHDPAAFHFQHSCRPTKDSRQYVVDWSWIVLKCLPVVGAESVNQ